MQLASLAPRLSPSSALLLAALYAGCAAPPAPATGEHASAAIDSLYAEFRAAYATLDADRVTALYAPDALYGSPDAPGFETGHTLIRRGFAGFFDAMARDSARLEIRFRFVGRFRSPTLASDVGYYWLRRVKGDSAGTPSVGKFTTVLAPDSIGRWQFVVDSYSGASLAAFDSAPPFEP